MSDPSKKASAAERPPARLNDWPMRWTLLRLAALGLALAAAFTGPSADGQDAATKARQEYSLSLKGKLPNALDFKLIGSNAEEFVKFEPEGLRITLPAGSPKGRPTTGLATGLVVKGDFDIRVRFETLKEPKPADSGPIGARFGLAVGLGSPGQGVARVSRTVHQGAGTQWVAWTNREQPSIPKYTSTTAKSGQLRLVRKDDTLLYYAAEEANPEFILLREQRIPEGRDDVRDVSLFAQTDSPRAELDIRFTDLRIRAESSPNVPSASDGAAPAAEPAGAKSWLLAAELLVVALGLLLAAGLGVWLYRRQSGAAKALPVSDPVEVEASAATVCFSCSCGKNLKAKAELVGKKVKCSQCGRPVLVRSALVLLTLAWGVTSGFAQAPDGDNSKTKLAAEYRQSLKGIENLRGLERLGPDAEECVKFEPEGLRILLPAGYHGVRPPTGMKTNIVVKGDFEISVRFEILKEPEPADTDQQTRLGMGMDLDGSGPRLTQASLSRRVAPRANNANRSTDFLAWMSVWNEAAGKNDQPSRFVATKAKSGRLRFVRTGALLSYYTAEGRDEDFTLLQQHPFGTEDVIWIRLLGSTGGPRAVLDVRFTDFHIRAASLQGAEWSPNGPSASDGTAPAAEPAGTKSWLLAAELVAVALGLLLAAGLGAWLYRRQSGAAKALPVSDPVEVEAAAVVCFSCSCGKNLKAKAELAGKKVKCSQCGQPVVVPSLKTA